MAAPMQGNRDVSRTENDQELLEISSDNHSKRYAKGVAVISGVAAVSMIFGFTLAFRFAKRKDPTIFSKSLMPGADLKESPASLALKALGWGTFYAVSGFSLFCFGTWKLVGAKNMDEFREQVGQKLPTLPKKPPEGRSEFKSVRDLFEYLVDEDEKVKSKLSSSKER